MEALNALFTNLLNQLTLVAATLAALCFGVGAVIYKTAAGSPRQMETGKTAMLNAVIGLALLLSARTVVGMIQSALGGG